MKIGRSTSPVALRNRDQGPLTGDVLLPVRYLSDDGLCAVDIITYLGNYAPQSTNSLNISQSAGAILAKCVYQSNVGGVNAIYGQ